MDIEQQPKTEKPTMPERGIALKDFVAQKRIGTEKPIADILKLVLKQNQFLSHIEVAFISPKEEPGTAGILHQIQIDKDTIIPTIFIVSEDKEHMEKLMQSRKESAKRTAQMLGIDFLDLTPTLLKQFIVAHELGHAADYIKNYETNPDYKGAEAAEEWEMHYDANLMTMPVPDYAPAELMKEMAKHNDLKSFIKAHPEISRTNEIKTLEDLLKKQELAYRTSPYESYADNFAANFLKQNAEKLNLGQLISGPKLKEAA